MNSHMSLMGLKVQMAELLEAAYDMGQDGAQLDQNRDKKLTDAQINKIKEISRNLGREEAWECAKKILHLRQGELSEVFPLDEDKDRGDYDDRLIDWIDDYSASEAIDKIKEWEGNKDTEEDKGENEETNGSGYWKKPVPYEETLYCSKCNLRLDDEQTYIPLNFCPNCGVKMEVKK